MRPVEGDSSSTNRTQRIHLPSPTITRPHLKLLASSPNRLYSDHIFLEFLLAPLSPSL